VDGEELVELGEDVGVEFCDGRGEGRREEGRKLETRGRKGESVGRRGERRRWKGMHRSGWRRACT
jgi:hypothetical protein